MVSYLHHVPGRLRVRMPGVKRNPPAARAVERALMTAQAGVTKVRANPLTGSVTVHYDIARTAPAPVLARLLALGEQHAESPAAWSPPAAPGMLDRLAERVVWALLERAALAMLGL